MQLLIHNWRGVIAKIILQLKIKVLHKITTGLPGRDSCPFYFPRSLAPAMVEISCQISRVHLQHPWDLKLVRPLNHSVS